MYPRWIPVCLAAGFAMAPLTIDSTVRLRAQQQQPASERQDDTPGERLEKVGSTMWRVKPSDTPYDHWYEKAKSSMPTFEGLMIQDVRTVPLEPWTAQGVNGLYVRMADYQIIDGWILEIPPRGSTKPMRHMFEAGVYSFGGPGHTVIQQEGRREQRMDWGYRSLFSIPMNVKYQHVNDGDTPLRIIVVTSFPFVINSNDSERYVWENPFKFSERYDAEEDYFRRSRMVGKREVATNLVKDALEYKLEAWDERGKGSTNMNWEMSGNSQLSMHVSEMPSKLYKRAHRHSSDAFVLLLSGDGYSLTWPEASYAKRVRVDWHEGTLFVPPIYWYHQHLNPGTTPARYLAINAPTIVSRLGLRFEDQLEPDLPPIEAEWKQELAKAAASGR